MLLHRETAKQQVKKNNKKQTHPVRLHAVDKYENAENVNTQNGYGTMSKK